jgi:hypothetical protein
MNTSAPTIEQREEIKTTGKTFSWWNAGMRQMNHTKWDSFENEWVFWLSSDKPSVEVVGTSDNIYKATRLSDDITRIATLSFSFSDESLYAAMIYLEKVKVAFEETHERAFIQAAQTYLLEEIQSRK